MRKIIEMFNAARPSCNFSILLHFCTEVKSMPPMPYVVNFRVKYLLSSHMNLNQEAEESNELSAHFSERTKLMIRYYFSREKEIEIFC